MLLTPALRRLFYRASAAQAGPTPPPPAPGDMPAGALRLSDLYAATGFGNDLEIASGVTVYVDMQMVTGVHSFGYITNAGTLYFSRVMNTKLIAAGMSTTGKRDRQIPIQFKSVLELNGLRNEVSGNPGGGPLALGATYVGNTITGNNGTTNDYGGRSRGLLDMEGSDVTDIGCVGAQHLDTQARLNADAAPGTHTIVSDRPLSWLPGWRFGLTPTSHFEDNEKMQLLTVQSISSDGLTITTVEAVTAQHLGRLMYAVDQLDANDDAIVFSMAGRTFSMGPDRLGANMKAHAKVRTNVLDDRAYLFLFDSNVINQCPADTEWTAKGFGFHHMRMGIASKSVVQNVHTERFGQKGLLGRYGIHDHINGYNLQTNLPRFNPLTGLTDGIFAAGQSVRKNLSFYDGTNRAGVIHTSRGSQWENCHSWGARGHSFMQETGAETKNRMWNVYGIEGVDPGAGFRLKDHESSPAGIWLANWDNDVRYARGIGCAVGCWNAMSPGLNGEASGQYGCLNESAGLPIAPMWAKFGALRDNATGTPLLDGNGDFIDAGGGKWIGNGGHGCYEHFALTDLQPINSQGQLTSIKVYSTDNGIYDAENTGNPKYADPHRTHQWLQELTGYRSRGYQNRVAQPIYDNAITCDIQGEHFHGQTDDNAIRFCHIAVRESKNPSMVNRIHGAICVGTDYHGTFSSQYQMAWGFGNGIYGEIFESHQMGRTSIKGSWDEYNEGINLNPGIGWKLCKSDATFRTPSPNLLDTSVYDSVKGLPAWSSNQACDIPSDDMRRHYWLNTLYDKDGSMSSGSGVARTNGRAESYIVFNHPFLTTGAADLIALPADPFSVSTSTICFGVDPHPDGYGYPGGLWPEHWRLDPNTLARIAGAKWTMPGPGTPEFPNGTHRANQANQNFSIVNNGCVELNYLDVAQFTAPVIVIMSNWKRATDWIVLCVNVNSVESVRTFGDSTYMSAAVGSKAALLAATVSSYWFDSANKKVYIKAFAPPPNIYGTASNIQVYPT